MAFWELQEMQLLEELRCIWWIAWNQSNLYIQNKKLSTSSVFSANNIYIGNNVNRITDCGDVIVTAGAKIKTQGQTVLDKGPVCKMGGAIQICKYE